MIVIQKKTLKRAIVYGINSNGIYYVYILPNNKELFGYPEILLQNEFEIEDNKIPKNWEINVFSCLSRADIPDWLDSQYNEGIFYLHSNLISSQQVVNFYEFGDHNYCNYISFDEYMVFKSINEILGFHNLDQINIPYMDEYENILMTPEQRRLKKIEDELNEGLKLLKQDDE